MKKLYKYLFSLIVFFPNYLFAQTPEHITINAGSLIGNVFPFSSTTNNKVQWIYSSANFNPTLTAGLITKLYIHSLSNNTSTYTNFTVRMGNTTIAVPTTGMTWLPTSDVFVLPTATYTVVSGQWWVITLQTPFFYDGVSNLVLECSESAYTGGGATIGQFVKTGAVGGRMWNNVTALASASSDDRQLRIGLDMVKENDLTPTKLVSPNIDDLCSGYNDLKVRVKNMGIIDVTPFAVNWSVDNVLQTPVVVTNTLQSYGNIDSLDIDFGNLNLALNVPVNLKVWTSNPNNTVDPNPANDTLSVRLVATRQGIAMSPLPDFTICKDGQIVIDAGYQPNTDYTWSNGNQTQQAIFKTFGTQWLFAYNTDGCMHRDTFIISETPAPAVAPIIAAIDMGGGRFVFDIANAQNIDFYEWDFGDGSPLEYGPGPKSHTYNRHDSFHVTLRVGNVCDTIVRNLLVVHQQNTSSNELIFDQKISVYPIPFAQNLNIQTKSQEQIAVVYLYNAVGQLVYESSIQSNNTVINLETLSTGQYLIKVKIGELYYSKSIIKE